MEENKTKSGDVFTMDAKEYLKIKGLKNPPLDSGISGAGDATRKYASLVMIDFAKRYSQHRISEIIKDSISAQSVIDRLNAENKALKESLQECVHSLNWVFSDKNEINDYTHLKRIERAEIQLKTVNHGTV